MTDNLGKLARIDGLQKLGLGAGSARAVAGVEDRLAELSSRLASCRPA